MSDILIPSFGIKRVACSPGTKLVSKGVFVYRCPLCGNEFRYDDPYEPMCTGPHPALDEHPPEVMQLLFMDAPKVTV